MYRTGGRASRRGRRLAWRPANGIRAGVACGRSSTCVDDAFWPKCASSAQVAQRTQIAKRFASLSHAQRVRQFGPTSNHDCTRWAEALDMGVFVMYARADAFCIFASFASLAVSSSFASLPAGWPPRREHKQWAPAKPVPKLGAMSSAHGIMILGYQVIVLSVAAIVGARGSFKVKDFGASVARR